MIFGRDSQETEATAPTIWPATLTPRPVLSTARARLIVSRLQASLIQLLFAGLSGHLSASTLLAIIAQQVSHRPSTASAWTAPMPIRPHAVGP
jgi:hypothetical protein